MRMDGTGSGSYSAVSFGVYTAGSAAPLLSELVKESFKNVFRDIVTNVSVDPALTVKVFVRSSTKPTGSNNIRGLYVCPPYFTWSYRVVGADVAESA